MPMSPMYYGMSNLAYVCFSSHNYAYEGWQPSSSNFTNPNLPDVYEGPNVILNVNHVVEVWDFNVVASCVVKNVHSSVEPFEERILVRWFFFLLKPMWEKNPTSIYWLLHKNYNSIINSRVIFYSQNSNIINS